jgi:recombinational DNA repair ATPase RecF
MRELRDLPTRMAGVESQILQLRVETRDGFSAIRSELLAEIRAGFSAIRSELQAEIRAGNSAIRSELLAEIRAGNEESRTFMRALYEDVIARIATMGEKDT